jgi:ferredoxin, 2Fe-2S
MVSITFIEVSGKTLNVPAEIGESVMKAARNGDVDAILADCGGSLSCATCHVHVAPEWWDRVGAPSETEREMLEMAIDPDETSRLSCQIEITEALDGLVLHLPKSQL